MFSRQQVGRRCAPKLAYLGAASLSKTKVEVRIPPSPPLSPQEQRLSPDSEVQIRKFPRFRGVLAVGVCRIRTGDGGFGARCAPRPHLSLSPIPAARFGLLNLDRTSARDLASWSRELRRNQIGSLNRAGDSNPNDGPHRGCQTPSRALREGGVTPRIKVCSPARSSARWSSAPARQILVWGSRRGSRRTSSLPNWSGSN